MVRTRPTLPAGHGELLTTPPIAEWAGLLTTNVALARTHSFLLAGVPAGDVRALARAEALERAELFSARLGIETRSVSDRGVPIVMTGHQPDLYHPGVWAKDFLLQRVAEETRAMGIDVVVDSDGFDEIALTTPCLEPTPQTCRTALAVGAPDGCYACTPVPTPAQIEAFCASGSAQLAPLPAPAVVHHFETFCDALRQAAPEARSLAELMTFARRRYEAPARTDYLELPLTSLAEGRAFALLVVDLALRAHEFAQVYNEELAAYRASHGTRSSAQPFPDLAVEAPRVELPLWLLGEGTRSSAYARVVADGVRFENRGGDGVLLPRAPGAAVEALLASGLRVAPKALALTFFLRLFVADLFIHGVGGARYDRVTDGVIRGFIGVDPPAYAVASLTMYLPLGARMVTDEELAAVAERRTRFEHNPDTLLEEAEFETDGERVTAQALVAEKASLVAAIAAPDADKKRLGVRIREVNSELRELLAPLGEAIVSEERALKAGRAAAEVLTDRTYPFCLWSPEEVADKVR